MTTIEVSEILAWQQEFESCHPSIAPTVLASALSSPKSVQVSS